MSEPWIGKREDRWTDYLPERLQTLINTSPLINALQQPRRGFDQAAREWQDSIPGNSPIDRIAEGRSTLAQEYQKPMHPLAADVLDKGSLLSIFLGPAAKTANLGALARARQMQSSGAPREQIWQQEGWFQGPDKKWRFEIDDSKSSLADISKRPILNREGGDNISPLHQTLFHPELFDAYPGLKYAEFQAVPGNGAAYRPKSGRLQERINVGRDGETLPATLHEAQHGVQAREKFALGGSPETAAADVQNYISGQLRELRPTPTTVVSADTIPKIKSLQDTMAGLPKDDVSVYHRLFGEVEARAVENRLKLSQDQRRERPPWLDYDVPESQHVVMTRDAGGIMGSVKPSVTAQPDPIVEAWNKGDTIKKIAHDHGVNYRTIMDALNNAKAAGEASPIRAHTVRAGLTDDAILNALRDRRTLTSLAAEHGVTTATLTTRVNKLKERGAFSGDNAAPLPVKGTPPRQWPEDVLTSMTQRYNDGTSMTQLARENGVSETHISDILKGRIDRRAGYGGTGVRRTDADIEHVRRRRIAGMPYSEIGDELGTTKNAVISLAHRARKRGVHIPAAAALTYSGIEAALNGQDTAH